MVAGGQSMRASGCRVLLTVVLAWVASSCLAAYDVDLFGVPRFVRVNYIDLTRIFQVSKFRSGAGHDYSDSVERCRSMKHYFMTPDTTTTIRSPVAGVVSILRDDFVGTQVVITSDAQPDFSFIIFHVALDAPLVIGQRIGEGQRLGTHVGLATYSDIAVEVNGPAGYRFVSYFDTLTDEAFVPFRARGAVSRDDFILSKAERDAYPFKCSGQEFMGGMTSPYVEHVFLKGGAAPPSPTMSVLGPLTSQVLILSLTLPANVERAIGSIFFAAVVPSPSAAEIYFLSKTAGWYKFAGCDSALATAQGTLYSGIGANVMAEATDLSALKGTVVYAGYGMGASSFDACRWMLDSGTYARAYVVQ
jgi:hypothetical protein